MSSDSRYEEKEAYTRSLNALGLSPSIDPFPNQPPRNVDYWADNEEVLSKVVQAEVDSALFDSSLLYVFWGPVGVGKTFAANYLASPTIDRLISKQAKSAPFKPRVFRTVAPYPKRTGELTFGVHRKIVSTLMGDICKDSELLSELAQVHNDMDVGTVRAAFKDIGSKVTRTLHGTVNLADVEATEGFKFLTGEKSRIGRLTDVNDLLQITKICAEIVLKKYTRLVIMIDELENLARSTATERLLFNDYLRRLHDDIDTGVTWIMIFTFDSYEDVTATLQASLISRIRQVIAFEYVKSPGTVKEYVQQCVERRAKVKVSTLMETSVLDEVSHSLVDRFRGKLSFRLINNEMHRIFARAYVAAGRPQSLRIDNKIYNELVSLKPGDILKEIKGAR